MSLLVTCSNCLHSCTCISIVNRNCQSLLWRPDVLPDNPVYVPFVVRYCPSLKFVNKYGILHHQVLLFLWNCILVEIRKHGIVCTTHSANIPSSCSFCTRMQFQMSSLVSLSSTRSHKYTVYWKLFRFNWYLIDCFSNQFY